ncbi:MAG: oxidoreductase [Bacteroides sp. SM23_62_1]|nr:MAG: oxidoreductase [Bacteroides sp. SM23_62_1]
MKHLKFAVFGTGFWSFYQISGWLELEGLELVAVCDKVLSKAQDTAKKFNVKNVYDNPEKLLDQHAQELDFVDIIADVDSHFELTGMVAKRGLDVVCQKPMAPDLETCLKMVQICRDAGVKLFINENYRWQRPVRRVKEIMDSGIIGNIFKARISFCSGFPVFENQPFLAELEQFILTDIGTHILDVCRFLLGEARTLYCMINRVNLRIKGEDVANVFMEMENGVHCYAEMSYASVPEVDSFPQPQLLVEGNKGTIQLYPQAEIHTTTRERTIKEVAQPVMYPWVDPDYASNHSCIVDAQRDLLEGLRGGKAETTGDDNFKTIRLVFASYDSARENTIIDMTKLS